MSRRRHSEHLTLPDEPTGPLRAQPLVRTRSSAHLLFGQLTGTCTSLLRRLSLKVRYLSLSLVPPHRPQSADRVEQTKSGSGEPRGASGRVRPRRHTTTVATSGCDEPSGRRDSKRGAKQVDSKRAEPESDSDATPTPSTPLAVPMIALEGSCSSPAAAHLLHPDDYPTLKASGTSRRRRRNQNKKSQTEVSTGRDETEPEEMAEPASIGVESDAALPALASDQSGPLDLNLSAPALDDELADDQDDEEPGGAGESHPTASDAEDGAGTQSAGAGSRTNSAKNPYLDWYLNCALEETPATADEAINTGNSVASVERHHQPEQEQQSEQTPKYELCDDLASYPILLGDWDASEKAKTDPADGVDPLAALHEHADWFEGYAFPAYSKAQTKATSAGGAASANSTNRMMAEKAYPYVSSPQTVRQKYAGYDPYDLLYEESYLAVPEIKSNNNNNNKSAPVSGVDPAKSERSAHPEPSAKPGQTSGTVQQQLHLSATVADGRLLEHGALAPGMLC